VIAIDPLELPVHLDWMDLLAPVYAGVPPDWI
jgi:hypothetical protein